MKQESPVYSASAFHPTLTAEETSGTIALDPQRLVFRSGEIDVELPLGEVELELDDTGRIQFSNSEQTDWVVFAEETRILKDYFIVRNNRLRQLARGLQQQREGRRVLRLAGIFVVGFVVMVGALNLASRWTMNFLVGNVPVAWESSLSDSILEDIRPPLKVVENPELLAVVKAAGEPLLRRLPANGYKFEFRLLDDPRPNAFALPGGRIYVNTGLLRTVSRPEEIAGVLAHEMAHVTQRHGLRQVISAAGPYYVLRIFISNRRGFLSTISNGSQFLVQQSFSRDFEREADDVGWRYLVAADVDPRGLREFLQHLLSDPILRILDGSSAGVLSSHPPTAERVAHLDLLWQQARKKSGFVKLPEPAR